MEVCVTSDTRWALSDGEYVDYGLLGEEGSVSERISHFCDFVSEEGWQVYLPETADELAEVLATLV